MNITALTVKFVRNLGGTNPCKVVATSQGLRKNHYTTDPLSSTTIMESGEIIEHIL